jgi:hypothetical protein
MCRGILQALVDLSGGGFDNLHYVDSVAHGSFF